MHQYNPHIHHRRSIRLKGYDYSREGLYFITLCTQNREYLFGNIENRKMKINEYGKIVDEEWQKTAAIRKNITIHEFITMPNHFHAILEIKYPVGGESQFAKKESPFAPNSTGGLQSAPNINNSANKMGEYQFSPTISSINNKGEYQFAPTAPTDIKFKSPSQTIGAIIRGFKGATTKRIKEFYLEEKNRGELKSSSEISTGELQFAPNNNNSANKMGEYQFAPNNINSANKMGEYQFAPTISLSYKIWQRNYYEHIIRDEQSHQRISEYIINNPAKWAEDKFYQE